MPEIGFALSVPVDIGILYHIMVLFMVEIQSYPMPSHAGSGPSKVISFLLKKDDLALLDEMVAEFPSRVNRSDVLREMIMPHLHALRLAKKGDDWEDVLERGDGLAHLRNLVRKAEKESALAFSFSI